MGQLNTNPLLPKINNNERLNAVRELKNRLEEFSNNALKISQKNSWEDYVNKLDQLVEQFKKN